MHEKILYIAIGLLYLSKIVGLFSRGSKFRIIKGIKNCNRHDAEIYYYIEQKRLFGYSRINLTEYNVKMIEFKSYEDAEKRLIKDYLKRDGEMKINGNNYQFFEYSYN